MYKDKSKQAQYQQKWYQVNRERVRIRQIRTARQNKLKVWSWFRDYKSKLSCSICPENHPACLHFHHRNPEIKRFAISTAVRAGLAIITILEEISKCDVLCANCHAKYHNKEFVRQVRSLAG